MLHGELFASLSSALLYFIISHPLVYDMTQKIFGKIFKVVGQSGPPTTLGLVLHSIVFSSIAFILMIVGPKEFLDKKEDSDMIEKMDEPEKHEKDE